MDIKIMSRDDIESTAQTQFAPSTALISITDADWTYAELKNKPQYLLQISFDDIDNDVFEDDLGRKPTEEERIAIEKEYNMLSDEQAKEIASFYKQIRGSATTVICQCEHGQSRSAAVAAAILEFESKSGITIFADDDYFPNKVVFRKVYKYLTE